MPNVDFSNCANYQALLDAKAAFAADNSKANAQAMYEEFNKCLEEKGLRWRFPMPQ